MSTPSPTAPATCTQSRYCPSVWLKPHLTVFHFTLAAAIGLATAGFTALIGVLLLISTNFNLLGWME